MNSTDQGLSTGSSYFVAESIDEYIRVNYLVPSQSPQASRVYSASGRVPSGSEYTARSTDMLDYESVAIRRPGERELQADPTSYGSDVLKQMKLLKKVWGILEQTSSDYSNSTFQVRTSIESTESLYMQIMHANDPSDVVDALKMGKFDNIAAQLTNLCKLVEDENETINLRSLQKFALFATDNRIFVPYIGINPDGHIQSVWKKPDYGSLVMDFSPSEDIVFSILFYPHESGFQQQRVSGVVSQDYIMYFIREFTIMCGRESKESVNNHPEPLPAWGTQIMNARTEDIIDILRTNNFANIANQLEILYALVEEEDTAMAVQSIQKFALFMARKKLPTPDIGINPDGHIQSVWNKPEYGSLVMDFSPSEDIVFSILFYPHKSGSQQQRVSGMVSEYRIMYYISEFVNKVSA